MVEPHWRFGVWFGTKWYDHEVVIYRVPADETPEGMKLWAAGFLFGESFTHNALGLWLYWGYDTRCIFATSLRLREQRRLLLSRLREQYLEVRSHAPFL